MFYPKQYLHYVRNRLTLIVCWWSSMSFWLLKIIPDAYLFWCSLHVWQEQWFKYKIWISAGNLKCVVLTKFVSSGISVSLYSCICVYIWLQIFKMEECYRCSWKKQVALILRNIIFKLDSITSNAWWGCIMFLK